uniref:Uncharacterized protein n=1 Tax=Triticum urartu TaxID=4572 RepID=A0A8R7R480_TRIUA
MEQRPAARGPRPRQGQGLPFLASQGEQAGGLESGAHSAQVLCPLLWHQRDVRPSSCSLVTSSFCRHV